MCCLHEYKFKQDVDVIKKISHTKKITSKGTI